MRVAFPKPFSGSDSAVFQGQLGLLDGNGGLIRLLRTHTNIPYYYYCFVHSFFVWSIWNFAIST